MALRNLGRNKRRSFLAGLSVFFAIFFVVALDGITAGFMDSMTLNYTKDETGHVNVATADYRERERFMPPDAAMRDSGAVRAAIEADPALSGKLDLVAERIRLGVVLSSGSASKTALALAGDPAAERRLLMLDRSVLPGGAYCDAPGTAIVGEGLATALGLKVGDELKVVTEKADHGLGFKKLKVSGLFRTGVTSLDGSTFQMGLLDARALLGLDGGAGGRAAGSGGATQVLVMLKDYRGADSAEAEIAKALAASGLKGLSVQSWTRGGDIPRLIAMANSIYFWAWLVVAFLGAFIITNVMTMVVLERRHEIGILKSMGMKRGRILALFLTEGGMLGAMGSGLGCLFGLALNAALAQKGIDFSQAMQGLDFPMDNVVRPAVHLGRSLGLFGLGVLVSTVMAWLPARKAAALDPIEAIRGA
jgi:putative ABC transport system permease protein